MKLEASAAIKWVLLQYWKLHRGLVGRNVEFKKKHVGETCYIFGNGASLKYYDISNLDKRPIIGCGYALMDQRLKNLNYKYSILSDSYTFYGIIYNTKSNKFLRNKSRKIVDRIIGEHPSVHFFANLTNSYAPMSWRKNVSFIHHFGERHSMTHDMAGAFGAMEGGLDIMLGTAKYMGFSKAILLGCDYLGDPTMATHFYADRKPTNVDYMPEYCARIKKASEGIDILVILPKGISSPEFNYSSYEEFFGMEKQYVENSEIIDEAYLDAHRLAERSGQSSI